MATRKITVSKEDALAILHGLRLMDDEFMRLCFADAPEVVEIVLRVVLSMPDLHVVSMRTQEEVFGIGARAVVFDVLAQDGNGVWYNVEIQRDERGASPRRARYHSSALDMHIAESGEKFDELPNAVVVFITETDTMHRNKSVQVFERRTEDGERLDDGSKIVYVNGEWRGEDDIGHLMADFMEADTEKMHYAVLADRVRSIKKPMVTNAKEGRMSSEVEAIIRKYTVQDKEEGREKGLEEGRAEGRAEGRLETARAMLARGIGETLVAECAGLTLEKVESLKKEIA